MDTYNIFTLPDGGSYYGELNENGLPHSLDALGVWPDGRTYSGSWIDGTLSGVGTMYRNGEIIQHGYWWRGELMHSFMKDGKPTDSPSPVSVDSWGNRPERKRRRVALLIGNCDYPVNRLYNCVSDAQVLSQKLQSLGFDSTVICDATKSHIVSSVQHFTQKAKDAEAALFFFSGHGISYGGKTYMVPIDCGDYSTIDSAFFCIDDVVNMLDEVSCNIKIAIIDACRTNPQKGDNKGLYDTKARNVLVAYATSPNYEASDGVLGTHSPYIDVILQLLDEPRIPLSCFFEVVSKRVYELTNGRQQPFIESSLIPNNDFFFNYG